MLSTGLYAVKPLARSTFPPNFTEISSEFSNTLRLVVPKSWGTLWLSNDTAHPTDGGLQSATYVVCRGYFRLPRFLCFSAMKDRGELLMTLSLSVEHEILKNVNEILLWERAVRSEL